MANLHFTLDKSAGKLLAQIAQEHLLCNLDPKKAIETFTMSLNDLPVEMAIKLLSGACYRSRRRRSERKCSFP